MKRTSSLARTVALSLLVCLISAGCAHLRRSHQSGYENSDWNQDVRRDERPRLSALDRAEKNLTGQYEREQYYKNRPYLANDRERVEFLTMDSFEARAGYLDQRGIDGNATPHPDPIQALIDVNDITLGMTKQAVRDSWGEPELVEVAGNPLYGNERWLYNEEVSSEEGFRAQKRMVYFESGRVVGWNSN
ncbi:MAG TPA: hypothetical protein VM432_00880 [Bdellovibrionales bacterium]|nr:hypothetical protein [Bdellovibrionales bacterium]